MIDNNMEVLYNCYTELLNFRRYIVLVIKNLTNGIKIIFDPIESANSACVGFFIKAGSIDEEDSNRGISHIIEHMVFKGTKDRTAIELSEEFDSLGISINAFTSEECTCFYAKSLPENLLKAIELYSDMLMHPLFDKKELSRELKVILEEYNMYRNNPSSHASSLFTSEIMKGTSFEVDIIGTKKSIKSTTREKIVDYYKNHYCNENCVICITGKYNEQAVYDYLEQNFTLFDRVNDRQTVLDYGKGSYQSYVKDDTEQSYIFCGTHIFGGQDDRVDAIGILSTLMGGSMSSRLFKSIREEQGLAYSVGSRVEFYGETGLFMISAGVSNDKVEDTIKSIQTEIEKLKDFSFTETEFLKAKNLYKSESIFDFEEMHHRMVEIGTGVLLDNNEDTIEDMIRKIDAVTYKDVKAVQDLITNISDYTWLIYSDREYFVDRILED